jgi:tetratricopeptide (TPR) repeat protein
MDDHVHPSLQGQDLVARSIVDALQDAPERIRVTPEQAKAVPSFEAISTELGANDYERYGVAHQIRILANIPFFRRTNPAMFPKFEGVCAGLVANWEPEIRDIVTDWQRPELHGGERRPLSSMVGRLKIRKGEFAEAEALYAAAIGSVSTYSSWSIEYTYFMLASRERRAGSLSDADRQIALGACLRGQLLLGQGRSADGQVERWVGRLRQMRGEYELSVPFLLTAGTKLGGTDLVANHQALAESYVRLGKVADARALIERGIRESGQYADLYKRMLPMLERK